MLRRRWHPSSPCLLFLLVLSSDSAPNSSYNKCLEHSRCGLHNVSYPFRLLQSPKYCGYPGYELSCSVDELMPQLTIKLGVEQYTVKEFDYKNEFFIIVFSDLIGNSCPLSFANTSIDTNLFNYASFDHNLTVYLNCTVQKPPDLYEITCLSKATGFHNSYYKVDNGPSTFLKDFPGKCNQTAAVPIYGAWPQVLEGGLEAALQNGFGLTWNNREDWCQGCTDSGGICGYNESLPRNQYCFCPNNTRLGNCYATNKRNKVLIIGLSVGGGLCVAMSCSFCFLLYMYMKKRRRPSGSSLLDRIGSFQPSSKSDSEPGCFLHAPIFKYEELYEATDGFDDSKELGDGGFGAVYKGKLRDGREVAVKRLYENNCRRVEQFMNEVNILSLLRHQNLVSLYGCTSRHSRELLLVYEFVPNGTVADHLHGSLASESSLSWHVRMSIAIETADALQYLHSVEPQIIHRDIKTTNILLDNDFHVKVADFGLSRLFPLDATHVSTAPQGTPGYVDPEYHLCYQLTEKSDVYSFGVVLAELISSKPAVDITRQRNEINLANMAINKIQRQELHEFVDLNLGYRTDHNINRMINQVAELAFQCLQPDGEMRPAIKDALEILRGIENAGQRKEKFGRVNDALKEEAVLLNSSPEDSPNSVTVGWVSMETTPNTSV